VTEEKKLTETEFHKKLAVDLFNLVWDLMDRKDRTREDDDRLVHAAHASLYHWSVIGEPVNLARGEWQVARAYSVLRRAEPAVHHARRSLELCRQHGIGDFDLAFGHEGLARALALAGDAAGSREQVELARKAAEAIAKPDDREYFIGELKTVPGHSET
jgi:hypothetical protein